jgi:hypothetical protein
MPEINVTFTAPDGTVIDFNDRVNTRLMTGIAGDLMPTFSLIEQQSPAFDGSVFQGAVIAPRDIVIPVHISDVSRPAVLARVRSMLKKLSPQNGDGQLTITSDGIMRVLNCRYKNGLSDDGSGDMQLTNWMKAPLTFRAGDPYFYAPTPIVYTINYAVAGTSFFPIPPMQLYNSNKFQAGGGATIVNGGDVRTWPIITITGPGSNPSITNSANGKTIAFNTTLAAGQVLIIDTSPLKKTVVNGQGVNRFPSLTPASSLFPLEVGNNTVSISYNSANTYSSISFSYKLAYLTV